MRWSRYSHHPWSDHARVRLSDREGAISFSLTLDWNTLRGVWSRFPLYWWRKEKGFARPPACYFCYCYDFTTNKSWLLAAFGSTVSNLNGSWLNPGHRHEWSGTSRVSRACEGLTRGSGKLHSHDIEIKFIYIAALPTGWRGVASAMQWPSGFWVCVSRAAVMTMFKGLLMRHIPSGRWRSFPRDGGVPANSYW